MSKAIQNADRILNEIADFAGGHPIILEVMDDTDPNTAWLEAARIKWGMYPRLWWDVRTAAYAAAEGIQTCLEIGTRTGWSLVQVFLRSPNVEAHVVEKWVPDYAGRQGSPESVMEAIQTAVRAYYGEKHYQPNITFHNGDSQDLLPDIVKGRTFDLIIVDGDHTLQGAFNDLMDTIDHVSPSGVLLFDDIEAVADPRDGRDYRWTLPTLLYEQLPRRLGALWLWMQSEHPEFIYLTPQIGDYRCGIAVRRSHG